jgi:hypothetical protein
VPLGRLVEVAGTVIGWDTFRERCCLVLSWSP